MDLSRRRWERGVREQRESAILMHTLPATREDIEELNALAFAAKASWGYPKHYLEIWTEEITVKPELLQNNRIFKVINKNNELLGFYGLEGTPPKLILEGFWVKPEAMGKGIGRALFQHMLQIAFSLKAQFVEWESDPNAYPFYVRMGAKTVGQRIYDLDGKKRELPILRIQIDDAMRET